MFRKILIANRGEIAVRVIRACREMGIAAAAVYSEADRDALHVRLADEAYFVGPAPPRDSYLSVERIIEAATVSGAEAIHPGYGFLSENPVLPEACAAAGIVFIGPSAAAMRLMGNKVAARRAMMECGVPVVPGTDILPDDPAAARTEVERSMVAALDAAGSGIAASGNANRADTARKTAPRDADAAAASEPGKARRGSPYPVLLKAAAGGGGKGMRVVSSAMEFESALAHARSEARSSFGDPSVYAEKFVARPRHIEVQILADTRGTIVHLGERECTIQRRHQKLLEETPSPVVDAEVRARLGEMAITVARAASYVGAGTCEFLRSEEGCFYFMEMNARLQVEHPVTEMVTGLDLVKEQIRIAAGEPIAFGQGEVELRGWAIECRIFAEDPSRGFMPSPGRIGTLRVPAGPGIRDDSGVYQGYLVPVHYDPLISKLIAWDRTREEAVARLRRALDEYRIEGVRTTIPFHRRVVRHPAFLAGDLDTTFIERYRSELVFSTGLAASGKASSPSTDSQQAVAMEHSNGAPLSTRDVAVIAAAIAAYRRAEAAAAGADPEPPHNTREGNGSGARAGSSFGDGRPATPTWARIARQGGWKISARLSALREK